MPKISSRALTTDGMESSRANREVVSCARAAAQRMRGKQAFTAETIRRWRKDFASEYKRCKPGYDDDFRLETGALALELAEITGRLPSYIEALRRSLQFDRVEMPVGWSVGHTGR